MNAIIVVTKPAKIGPDISFTVIFLNKHPRTAPSKIWIDMTRKYIGMASIISKMWTKADNIIGPMIVGPGILSLTAKYQPDN